MTTTWSDYGIDLGGRSGIEVQTTCPQCSSARRKNPRARCLSVNTDKGVWVCHHCGWTGSLRTGHDRPSERPRVIIRPHWTPPDGVDDRLAGWFSARGIPADVVAREGIALREAYLPQVEAEVPCIAFPYRRAEEVINVKYRSLTAKYFRQVAGAEQVLYRVDRIAREQVVVVEGEVDALSVVAAGIDSVVSVPNGAPAPNSKTLEAKFQFLDQDPDPFSGVERIVLAVDADVPGQALADELARRLGRDRCYTVAWPASCKDPNDVLRAHGPEVLRQCLVQATPWPIEGVLAVADLADCVRDLYRRGLGPGLSTGWSSVDRHYTIEPGQLSIVTGIPSHGKSEFVDALSINLMQRHGWRIAMCSPENWPPELHLSKLAEKIIGKPFGDGLAERMSPPERDAALAFLDAHLTMIAPDAAMTIPALLDRATSLVRRHGIRGLVLDPWNEFDHARERTVTETDYVGETLGAIKRWARTWSVHVWVVAHPQKLYRHEDHTYPVPTPYDISGSAHWRNKADHCVTVWRDLEQEGSPVQIHIQKVRFRHLGRPGLVELRWDGRSGRYVDPAGATAATLPAGLHEETIDAR